MDTSEQKLNKLPTAKTPDQSDFMSEFTYAPRLLRFAFCLFLKEQNHFIKIFCSLKVVLQWWHTS